MTRPTFTEFKKKALANSEVKQEYDALCLEYKLRKLKYRILNLLIKLLIKK